MTEVLNLNSWATVATLATITLVVSAITVQLYSIVRKKETVYRLELEDALLKQRHAETKLLLRHVQLLKSELEKLSRDPVFSERLETARKIAALLEETISPQ